ncbi:MAG: carboxypeptidase regulatory-like domain-containing protein [Eggerthellaceae bacterium]|nr:carboxypeptidase regulatory-like domain-containing protein [Eggerthellaceae bacterium]
MTKAFLIDLNKCVGCYDCQIGCKDEHCGNDWSPYAKPQPDTGQFWMHVLEEEHGARPHVKVSYVPVMCQHCDDAPCMKVAEDGAVYRREDGIIIVDPEKAKGQKKIAEACPFHAVFWNEELQIPQKCTGCSHLVDRGYPISVPRCVDNCHMDAIQFGEENELDLTDTEKLHPEFGLNTHVYYRGLPKTFVAGKVYDPENEEVIIGGFVTLRSEDESWTARTDAFGDFWLRDVAPGDYTLLIQGGGKKYETPLTVGKKSIGLGNIPVA